jgi:hypothetical protein
MPVKERISELMPAPFIPPFNFPKVKTIGVGVHAVVWQTEIIAPYSTLAQAKAGAKYLKLWLRRLGKAFVVESEGLTLAMESFLADATNPANGFNPPWNVL